MNNIFAFDLLYRTPQNKNAIIASRTDRTGKSRTETRRRDGDAVKMAVSTDPRNNSTSLFIDFPFDDDNQVRLDGPVSAASVRLDGRQARTLYRLLRKHYSVTGKSRKG